MNALKQIEAGGTIAYKVAYARLPGSDPIVAIFLSQVAYWSARNGGAPELSDGWCWITHHSLEEQTGISQKQQDRAAKILSDLGVLEKELKGIPAKIHYRVDFEKLASLLSKKDKPRLAETANLLYKEKITEETTSRGDGETGLTSQSSPSAQPPEQITPLNAPAPTDGTGEVDSTREPRTARRRRQPPQAPPPPTLDEWMAHFEKNWPETPKARAELEFAKQEAKGWMRNSKAGLVPVVSWRGVAHTCFLFWKQDNPQAYANAKRERETAARNPPSYRGPYAE